MPDTKKEKEREKPKKEGYDESDTRKKEKEREKQAEPSSYAESFSPFLRDAVSPGQSERPPCTIFSHDAYAFCQMTYVLWRFWVAW